MMSLEPPAVVGITTVTVLPAKETGAEVVLGFTVELVVGDDGDATVAVGNVDFGFCVGAGVVDGVHERMSRRTADVILDNNVFTG
jgi:hypothetical protein